MQWIAWMLLLAANGWDLHSRRGEALEGKGEYAAAAGEFAAALVETARMEPGDWRLPLTLHNLGTVERELGHYPEAERRYRQAISIWEKRHPRREAELAASLQNLAAVYLVLGRLSQAEPLYRRAYELRRAALGEEHSLTGATLHGLAELMLERRRFAEADDLFRRASAILKVARPGSLEAADLSHNRASLYRDMHRDAEARALLEDAWATYERVAPEHPKAAIVLRNLAELEAARGEWKRAGGLFERAVRICDVSLPAGHPQTGIILQAYARFLGKTGRKKEARTASERSQAILAKYSRESGAGATVDASAFVGR
jgi:tetratricopeptide (TPR) repeat protein